MGLRTGTARPTRPSPIRTIDGSPDPLIDPSSGSRAVALQVRQEAALSVASRDPRVEKRPEFTFEVGRHLEEFQPQRVDDERIGAAVPDRDRLVDEIVGL